jgi:hypothetical protein
MSAIADTHGYQTRGPLTPSPNPPLDQPTPLPSASAGSLFTRLKDVKKMYRKACLAINPNKQIPENENFSGCSGH